MKSGTDASASAAKPPFVYVNDKECALLEDYRLAVYQYFAEGTELYDPAYTPPRKMALGAEGTEEYGVTLRKLQPEGRYHAFFEDPSTGMRYPQCSYTCVYLTNLPPKTTPEMLGRFFEAFDLVKGADVFRGRHTTCDGRGWVVLQDAAKVIMVPPVLDFYNHIVYVHLSTQEPQRNAYAVSPPPVVREVQPPGPALPVPRGAASRALPPPTMVGSSDGAPSSPTSPIGSGTALPQPRSSRIGVVPPRSASGFGLPPTATAAPPAAALPPPPPPSGSSPVGEPSRVPPLPRSSLAGAPRRFGPRSFFYTCIIAEADVLAALNESVYRPASPIIESELVAAVEARNDVYLLMILDMHAALFGVARLLPAPRRRSRGLPVEWLSPSVYLKETALRPPFGFSFSRVQDGTAIKPEIGARICEIAEASPALPRMPDNLPLYPGAPVSGPVQPRSPMVPSPAGRGRGGGAAAGSPSSPGVAGQSAFSMYSGPNHASRAPPAPSGMAQRKSAVGAFPQHGKGAMGPPKAVGDSPPAGPAIPVPASKRNAAAAAALGSPTSADASATPLNAESTSKGVPEIPKPASSVAAAAAAAKAK